MEKIEEIFLNYATEYFRAQNDYIYELAINLEDFKKLIAENFTPKVSRVDAKAKPACEIKGRIKGAESLTDLLLMMLEKLEEIRCGIIDVETATEQSKKSK